MGMRGCNGKAWIDQRTVVTIDLGILDLARLDHCEAGALDFLDDLVEEEAFEIIRVKGRRREKECETSKNSPCRH